MLPCHRPASLVTLSTAFPSSSRQHRGRLRRSNTSCAGGNLLLPTRLQPLSLLVAMGAPLRLSPLPRYCSSLPPGNVIEPVTGRTPSPSRPPPNLAVSTGARGCRPRLTQGRRPELKSKPPFAAKSSPAPFVAPLSPPASPLSSPPGPTTELLDIALPWSSWCFSLLQSALLSLLLASALQSPLRNSFKAAVRSEVKPAAVHSSLKSAGLFAVKPAGSNHRAP